ncbi:MAG: single-stranded DNA-binding protein [Desulfobulbaceae bacterium]|nr:single-stranded DNA-binding protein [Desulfobulbaceae bacterium]
MSNLNTVLLMGNIGQDFELRQTRNGNDMCLFNIAVNETWVDTNGQKHQKVYWHKIRCYGRTAANAFEYLGKGCQIIVNGALKTEEWEDREGRPNTVTVVTANELTYMTTKASLQKRREKNLVYGKFQEGDEEYFDEHMPMADDDEDIPL